MSVLNGDQFFHGTTYPITDMVRPANDTDHHVSEYSMGDPGDMSEGDHAFVSRNNEAYAWHAAHAFHVNGRRPRVYETGPAEDMKPGPWNKEHPDFLAHHELDDPDYPPSKEDVATAESNHQDEWASKTGFPVRRRIDIMPGRQGTFPEINWNRFKQGGHRTAMGLEVNHPTSEQVQYGMMGHPGKRASDPRNFGPDEGVKRRGGASLRAFLEGKPDPGPLADHPRLF